MSLSQPAIASPYIHASVKRRKNTWYSIKDGNWSDPNTWMSNALSFSQINFNYPSQSIPNPVFPQVGDDVYINHSIIVNVGSSSVPIIVNNLYISNTLLFDNIARTITVNGSLQSTGVLDMSGASHNIILMGAVNSVSSLVAGSGTITYSSNMVDQTVMNLPYNNLTISGFGYRYLAANLTVYGNLLVQTVPFSTTLVVFELGSYDLTVNGTTIVSYSSTLSKSSTGNLLFIGLTSQNTTLSCTINFSGNPNMEFRGGLSSNNMIYGTGNMRFTTNDQTFSTNSYNFFNVITIENITVTHKGSASIISTSINGTTSTSKLINNGVLYFPNYTVPMSTGLFDYVSVANTIGYIMNGDFTIPDTTYWSLVVSGSGTKTTIGNMSLTGSLSVTGILQLLTYNLIVNTTTSLSGTILKSGTGSVLFIGLVTNANGTMDFSIGSPNVEFRGGIQNNGSGTYKIGSGIWSFTTNNQNISQGFGSGSFSAPFDSEFLISGAITITHKSVGGAAETIIITGSITGDNAASTFDNRQIVNYQGITIPMSTGILQCNAGANTFRYNLSGDQNVAGGTYRTLEFGGSGVKTLQGNIIVNTTAGGSWSITGSATINYNGFTITTI